MKPRSVISLLNATRSAPTPSIPFEFEAYYFHAKMSLRDVPSQTRKRAISDHECHAPSKTPRRQNDNNSTATKENNSLRNSRGFGDKGCCASDITETTVDNFPSTADTAKEYRSYDPATSLNGSTSRDNVAIMSPSQPITHSQLLLPPDQLEAYSFCSPPFRLLQTPDMSGSNTSYGPSLPVYRYLQPDTSASLPLSSEYSSCKRVTRFKVVGNRKANKYNSTDGQYLAYKYRFYERLRRPRLQ